MAQTPTSPTTADVAAMVERWSPRRQRRDRRSEVETTVLDAAERLLGEVPLRDLEVKQIMAEASISRTTFYQYFSSKFDVLAALVGRTVAEILEACQVWLVDDEGPARERMHGGLEAAGLVWHRHRNVYNAAAASWATDPELARLWSSVYEEMATMFTEAVEREIELGRARPDGDVRSLVTALVWGSERVFHIAASGAATGLPDIESGVDALYRIWSAAIYGPEPA